MERRETGGLRETVVKETSDRQHQWALISDRNSNNLILSDTYFTPLFTVHSLHHNFKIRTDVLINYFKFIAWQVWHMLPTPTCQQHLWCLSCGNGARLPSPGHKQPYVTLRFILARFIYFHTIYFCMRSHHFL